MEDVDNVEQAANKQLLQHNLLAGLLPRHPPHCSCAHHAIPSCSVLSPLKEEEAKGGGGWGLASFSPDSLPGCHVQALMLQTAAAAS